MPASRYDRVVDLLERHVFAEQLLLSQALEIHTIRQCCVGTTCLGAEALKQSVNRLHIESLEWMNGTKKRQRRTALRTPSSSHP